MREFETSDRETYTVAQLEASNQELTELLSLERQAVAGLQEENKKLRLTCRMNEGSMRKFEKVVRDYKECLIANEEQIEESDARIKATETVLEGYYLEIQRLRKELGLKVNEQRTPRPSSDPLRVHLFHYRLLHVSPEPLGQNLTKD